MWESGPSLRRTEFGLGFKGIAFPIRFRGCSRKCAADSRHYTQKAVGGCMRRLHRCFLVLASLLCNTAVLSRFGGGWDGDCCHFGSRPICNSLHHPPTQLFLVQISHSLTTLRLFVCSRAFPSGRAGRCQRHGGHRKARLCDISRLSSSTSVTSSPCLSSA